MSAQEDYPVADRTNRAGRTMGLGEALGNNPQLSKIMADLESGKLKIEPPPAPVCASCGDIGYFKFDVPIDDPRFGKLQPCDRCQKGRDLAQKKLEGKLHQIGLPTKYADCNMQQWYNLYETAPELVEGKRAAVACAHVFCESEGHRVSLKRVNDIIKREFKGDDTIRNSIVLQGAFGLGKTSLAAAIVNHLRASNEHVLFIRAYNIVTSVQDRYGKKNPDGSPEYPSTEDVKKSIYQVPILIIDEFGISGITPDRRNIMEEIIRYRHNNDLPTIITMNEAKEQLIDLWGNRIYESFKEMAHWIPMGGLPLRQSSEFTEAI